jgi:hypothetical protein
MTRAAAVAAAKQGWAVFPCRPGDKRPAVPDHPEDECARRAYCRDGHQGWEQLAVSDPDRIARYWPSDRHNIGVACGPSRLVVIDLDVPKPDEGKELPAEWRELPGVSDGKDVFAVICEWAGMDWPYTCTVATPSGGWHLYFEAPAGSSFRNTADTVGPMIDTRAHGGYVVGAGSVTSAGAYEVLYDEPVQPLPRWIARLLTPPERPKGNVRPPGSTADSGRRLQGLVRTVEAGKPRNRTGPLVFAAFRLREMIASGEATETDARLLVQAAVSAGINGGEHYAWRQVRSVLGRAV